MYVVETYNELNDPNCDTLVNLVKSEVRMNKVKAILLTIVIQLFFLVLVFFGFLLDPLIGIWTVSIYFLIIGSFLLYFFVLNKFEDYSLKYAHNHIVTEASLQETNSSTAI